MNRVYKCFECGQFDCDCRSFLVLQDDPAYNSGCRGIVVALALGLLAWLIGTIAIITFIRW